MTACPRCPAEWSGHRAQHCPGCHETFTGTSSGDMHRVGKHDVFTGPERRRCLTVAEMADKGMTRNKRGQWTTGEAYPAHLHGTQDGRTGVAEGPGPSGDLEGAQIADSEEAGETGAPACCEPPVLTITNPAQADAASIQALRDALRRDTREGRR